MKQNLRDGQLGGGGGGPDPPPGYGPVSVAFEGKIGVTYTATYSAMHSATHSESTLPMVLDEKHSVKVSHVTVISWHELI